MSTQLRSLFLCSLITGLPQAVGCADDDPTESGESDTGQPDESRGRDLGSNDAGSDDGDASEDAAVDNGSTDVAADGNTEDAAEEVADTTHEDGEEEVADTHEVRPDIFEGCVAPIPGELVINEVLAAPATGGAGDSNCDGTRNGVDDEFIELVSTHSGCLDLSGVTINKTGAVPLNHTFVAETFVQPGGAIVVFGGPPGGVAVFDGSSASAEPHCVDLSGCSVPMQLASQGALALPNAEDTITITLGATTLDTYAYGGDSGNTPTNGESMVRNPEVSGNFATHTSVNPGLRQSPGTRADGTPFVTLSGCDP